MAFVTWACWSQPLPGLSRLLGAKKFTPHPIDKAAALCESLIVNHPFTDGNKRIGFIAMAALLLEYGLKLTATQQEAYDTIISVSTGKLHYEGLLDWLKDHVVPIGGT